MKDRWVLPTDTLPVIKPFVLGGDPIINGTSMHQQGVHVHYGTFPGKVSRSGALESVWVVLRPHNWHPKTSEEALLELHAETGMFTLSGEDILGFSLEIILCRPLVSSGEELSRVKIPSRFSHDAVRGGILTYDAMKAHIVLRFLSSL